MVVSSRMLKIGCYRRADAVEFCACSPTVCAHRNDSKCRDGPPDTSTQPEPLASGLALASASGKSGLSVPAAVEAADGGKLPRAVPPPGGPLEI